VLTSPDTDTDIVGRLRAAGCVFAKEEAELLTSAATTTAELSSMADQRVSGLPIEHVVGWADFCGLRILVGPGVFVPRRRTEFLVRQSLRVSVDIIAPIVIVDMCCGTGALGIAVAAGLDRDIELHACDIDPGAASWARRNVGPIGGRVYVGDLFAPLPAGLCGRVDVLLANAPYVPTDEIALLPAEARVHEPRVSLDGGHDGLDVLRRVIAEAGRWLAPRGRVLVETTERQLPDLLEAMATGGLQARTARSARLHATVVVGTRTTAR
jgi:release factor glutamine methyltransferase